MSNSSIPEVGGRSAKFALILLVLVYVFNFIDRQILTILAEDLKADLNIKTETLSFVKILRPLAWRNAGNCLSDHWLIGGVGKYIRL